MTDRSNGTVTVFSMKLGISFIMKILTLECHLEEVLKNLVFFWRKQHAIYLRHWNALSFCLEIKWEQKYCGQTPADSNIGFILTNFCFAACNLTSLNITKTNKPFPMDQMATGHIFILNWICKVIWIFAFYLCNFHCNSVYNKKKLKLIRFFICQTLNCISQL